MTTHELKTVNPYFNDVWAGWKNFEIRKEDRDYKENDILIQREYNSDTDSFSGRSMVCSVDYILHKGVFVGLHPDYCCMGIDVLQRRP